MTRKPSLIVTELAAMVAASVLKKAVEEGMFRNPAVQGTYDYPGSSYPIYGHPGAPHLDGYQRLMADALHGNPSYEIGISPFLTDAEYQEGITRLGYELDRGMKAVARNPEMEPDDGRDGE